MTDVTSDLRVRPAAPADVPALCELLNRIIEIGGTTAYQETLAPAQFSAHFLTGPGFLSCFVAEQGDGQGPCGFQALERHDGLADGWADIATFARPLPKVPGVGRALFAATRARALELGLAAINATIRADNTGGLAYYDRMGFETYKVAEAVPLRDGTPVDRISKRFLLRPDAAAPLR